MNGSRGAIQDHLAALADPTRGRIVQLLEGRELTVTELRGVLQLPQSTVSRHLKALGGTGWVVSRSEGTSRLYSMARDQLEPVAQRLWSLVRDQLASGRVALSDQRRLEAVLSERGTTSKAFFASSAGRWDRVRDDLFGPSFHLTALLGLLDGHWTVGDLGCGTGRVTAALAPFVRRVIAVDGSAAMLRAARKRAGRLDNVDLRRGELEALPLEPLSLDAATLILVLHHVSDPARVIAEVARVLRPGGRLLVVDMLPHDREAYRLQMGHVWLGFGESQMLRYLRAAGFGGVRIRTLSPDTSVKGPPLLTATASIE